MISIKDLTKSFYHQNEEVFVLKNLTLRIDKGDVFGLIGQNGAGKSTLINIMLDLMAPNSGEVLFNGVTHKSDKAKSIYGAMSEQPKFYDQFNAEEILHFICELYEIRNDNIKHRIDVLLSEVGLTEAKKRRVKNFSKGMHQRLALAAALINEPKILILDEPFDGLDPLGRKQFKDIISFQKSRGVTIFFSSHILSDVQEICTKVGVLKNGTIIPAPLSTKNNLENKLIKLLDE